MAAESKTPTIKNKVCLISIDGWGMSHQEKGNAVFHAHHPTIDELLKDHLHSVVEASGLAVGLPEGLMGNSEVGHLTMGSGRVLYQDLTRINLAVKDGSIGSNKALVEAFNTAKQRNSRLHFLGLISDGGVHSHIDHLKALLAEAKKAAVPQTYVHFFADGRDTPPTSATVYIKDLQEYLAQQQYGTLATVMGRYYAMDRDKRWERIAVAYDGLIAGKGQEVKSEDLVSAVEQRYQNKENDEFLKPLIVDKQGTLKDNDVLLFFDFRSDRMRQIVETLGIKPPFEPSVPLPANLHIVQMTQYNEKWSMPIMFPPQNVDNVLAEWISKANMHQFHTAETEKYAHVTFFFNGGREIVFANEERGLIPSPKVPTYDHKPEMSMDAVADSVVKAIEDNKYEFVMCNLAAPDMVGHTGIFDAAVKAVTACDAAIGKMWAACKKHGWVLVITADHGNAEEMVDENGAPKTAHTTNPVFLIIGGQDVTKKYEIAHPKGGLRDVAPTVIYLLGLPECKDMTGTSVVKQK